MINSGEGIPFSSEDIWAALNERFPEKRISPRTVRYHLNQLGFPQLKGRLVKKTKERYYPVRPAEIKEVARLARSQKISFRLVYRAQMVLQVVAGYSLQKVAAYLHRSIRTVQKWLTGFSRWA